METKNVNLYLYNSKKTVDSIFNALYNDIDKPMTASQFNRCISSIQPVIKDGHNNLLPGKDLQNYYAENAFYFPLDFIVSYNKLYVTQNFSDDKSIQIGDEITSINGETAITIFNKLVSLQVRDGDNLLYPEYLSEFYFRSFYGFYFGFPKEHQLELTKANGAMVSITLHGLKLNVIQDRRKLISTPRYDETHFTKGISWDIKNENKYAILNIRTWSNDLLKLKYHQKFKSELQKFIEELKQNPPQNLIIDLRGNQGGDGLNGILLLQHLLNKPFNYFTSVKAYNKKMETIDVARLLTKTYKPKNYVYTGNVYVLTNAGSFSNSAIFAKLIQHYNRGKIAGSETGGDGILLSGGAGYYVAPNTKLNLLKVTNQMITTVETENTGRGVKPDIEINPSLSDILENNDVVLEQLIKIISIEKQLH
ncbi:MAG: S41 family peptidase [Bacteroidota bacterium]